jgi:hypothetical protein
MFALRTLQDLFDLSLVVNGLFQKVLVILNISWLVAVAAAAVASMDCQHLVVGVVVQVVF